MVPGRDRILLALLALLAAAALGWENGLGRLDRLIYDAFMASRPHAPHPEIVIVGIDDKSLAELGRWPWRRDLHADLIERISAQGPRAIGLDLLLSEPDADSPRMDDELAGAIRRSGVVVLPVFMARLAGRDYEAMLPVARFASAANRVGHVSVELDGDGIARSVFLREGARGRWFDHFAVSLLQTAGRGDAVEHLPGRRDPQAGKGADDDLWHRDYWMHIAFAGPPGTYPVLSAADVLRGDVAENAFRGKIVLLGPTAVGLGDVYPTPVSGQSIPMAGVEISANVIDNLMTGTALAPAAPWQGALFAVVMVGLLLAGLWRLAPRRALLLTAALVAASALCSYLCMRLAGRWLAPGAALATMLLLYPLWLWRRLEAAVGYLGAELFRLRQVDPVLPGVPARARGDLVDRRIGALQEAADHLRTLHLFISSTLDSLPDATLVADDAGTVMLGNQAAARYFGSASADALRGSSLPALLHGLRPLRGGELAVRGEAAGGDEHGIECRDERGGEFLFKRTRSAGLSGQPGVWIVCLVDLYALRQAQRERDEALRFLSHDMRAPQSSIRALLDLHRSDAQAMPGDELLTRIRRHSERTLELAEAFVQVARAGSMEFAREPVDYADIMMDAADACWDQACAKRIRVVTELADQAPGHGSRELLTRAVTNVLSNAIKYSPEGTVVQCAVHREAGRWCLAVRDRGCGIAEADHPRVFQRFARFGPSEAEGVGLGLAFAKTVVDRHGGSIVFDSKPGEGTEFRFYFPV